jgi:hypothetical protein
MSEKTAAQKGNALEQAVKSIEESILRNEPRAGGHNFTIECKKVIKVDEVPHEIDVYVTVHFGPNYQSLFIFECKNWVEPIDKNHIIIFSEKISASRAAHGYFVAKAFTAGAKAQAEKDKRITLFTVKEHDPLLLAPSFPQRGITWSLHSVGFTITARDASVLRAPDQSLSATYKGSLTTIGELIKSIGDELIKGMDCDPLINDLGEHSEYMPFLRKYEPGELEIGAREVDNIQGEVEIKVFIYDEVIDYAFDVATRGRVIQFKPVQHPDGIVSRSRMTIR